MNTSIKRQISMIFMGLVVSMLLISILINSQFLGQYYIFHKQNRLIDVYEELEEASKKQDLNTESSYDKLNELVEVGNITFVVLMGEEQHSSILAAASNQQKTQDLMQQLMRYMMGDNQKQGKLLKKGDSYEVYSMQDPASREEYIEMYGTLENGECFLLRTPLESIRESVGLSNNFLIYTMIVLIMLGSLVVWYGSKRITEPIMELAELSRRMADLDFEAKYVRGGKNEIGVLGENFNIMSETLEKKIGELKDANYQLQKDIEKKEKLETMRTEFIANVSHELKTPIALIQGYAEGLKEGISDDAESREFYCDVILDEAKKMNQMVKNLLVLQQVEHGQEQTEFSRFDLTELIRGVIMSCDILIQQKQVKVTFESDTPVFVWADEYKVEHVFRNYFTNALNHVQYENVIEVKVTAKEEDKVRISVFNSGNAIPEEELEHIWEKFYKVDKAHTREYGGNGIGLSIVKAIMESFQQKYGVENYSNGVVFWFELDTR